MEVSPSLVVTLPYPLPSRHQNRGQWRGGPRARVQEAGHGAGLEGPSLLRSFSSSSVISTFDTYTCFPPSHTTTVAPPTPTEQGHQYLASMRRCPALLLVSVGEDEAKVRMNISLSHHVNGVGPWLCTTATIMTQTPYKTNTGGGRGGEPVRADAPPRPPAGYGRPGGERGRRGLGWGRGVGRGGLQPLHLR